MRCLQPSLAPRSSCPAPHVQRSRVQRGGCAVSSERTRSSPGWAAAPDLLADQPEDTNGEMGLEDDGSAFPLPPPEVCPNPNLSKGFRTN